MSVSVIILGGPSESTVKTERSSLVAGESIPISISTTTPAEVPSAIARAEDELIHVVQCSDIVLPSFYLAMTTTISFSNLDYVVCPMLDLTGDDGLIRQTDDPFCSQVIFKKWVAEELGMPDMNILLQRLVGEYQGKSVPHVLCVRD